MTALQTCNLNSKGFANLCIIHCPLQKTAKVHDDRKKTQNIYNIPTSKSTRCRLWTQMCLLQTNWSLNIISLRELCNQTSVCFLGAWCLICAFITSTLPHCRAHCWHHRSSSVIFLPAFFKPISSNLLTGHLSLCSIHYKDLCLLSWLSY